MAGYSETPLLKKLGYKPGEGVFVVAAPANFLSDLSAGGITATDNLPADWAHGFFTSSQALRAFLLISDLELITKGLWVSWPKKASGVATDLTEQTFRDLILPTGWVDTKVCAIDDTWSGLKFLRRRSDNAT